LFSAWRHRLGIGCDSSADFLITLAETEFWYPDLLPTARPGQAAAFGLATRRRQILYILDQSKPLINLAVFVLAASADSSRSICCEAEDVGVVFFDNPRIPDLTRGALTLAGRMPWWGWLPLSSG
jgi:hypothetical protein